MTLGFYMVLFEIESAAGSKKKTCKNEESQQTIGPPYLVMEYEVSVNPIATREARQIMPTALLLAHPELKI